MKERDCGHDFLRGFFYEDDEGERVFQRENPERFAELEEETRQALQPKVAIVESLLKQGMAWEDIYVSCGFFRDGIPRSPQLQARIMRKWFLGWAPQEVIKELAVPNPDYPRDCRYREECPKARKMHKMEWGDWSTCGERLANCPRWPEDVRGSYV